MKLFKNILLALILLIVLILGGLLLSGETPTVVNDVQVVGHIHNANCGHFRVL